MKTHNTDQNNSSVDIIDRNSYEPAYAQLANILRRQVAAGVFRPGRLASAVQYDRAGNINRSAETPRAIQRPGSESCRLQRFLC